MLRHCQMLLLLLIISTSFVVAQNTSKSRAEELLAQQDYRSAAKMYQLLAQAQFEEANYPRYLEYSIAQALALKKNEDHEAAIEVLSKGIEKARLLVGDDLTLAKVYHELGIIYYTSSGALELSIEAWEKALNIREKLLPSDNVAIAKGYRNIGNAYYYLDQYVAAKVNYTKGLNLQLKSDAPDIKLLSRIYKQLSYVAIALTDYKQAEDYLEAYIGISEKIYQNDPYELAKMYEAQFWFFDEKEEYEKAQAYTLKAAEAFKKAIRQKGFDAELGLAKSHNNLAEIYYDQKKYAEAINFYEQAYAFYKRYPQELQEQIANVNYNLAGVKIEIKDLTGAARNVEIGIEIYQKLNEKVRLAQARQRRAKIYTLQNKFTDASIDLQEAISLYTTDFEPATLYDLPKANQVPTGFKPYLVDALSQKADLLKDPTNPQTNSEAAKNTYDLIIELIDDIRLSFNSDESKGDVAYEAKEIYEAAIGFYYQLFLTTNDKTYLEQAYQISEHSKSKILLDVAVENNAKIDATIPTDLLEREIKLKEEIALVEEKLHELEGASSSEKIQFQEELIAYNLQLEQFIDTLEQTYPKYYDLKYNTDVLTIEALQASVLTAGQDLIEYFVGDSSAYVFVIQADKLYGLKLNDAIELEETISKVQQLTLEIPNQSNGNYQERANELTNYLTQLYEQLIAPIEAEIPLHSKLTIIPDGVLGYLPFELLIKSPAEGGQLFKQHQYLIQDYQISYAYSASLLEERPENRSAFSTKGLLAMAPSFDAIKSDNIDGEPNYIASIRDALYPLNNNQPEAIEIQALVGGDTLVGQAASKADFLNRAADYSILHFATHGKANDEIGDYSYIAFTPDLDASENSYLLYNRELYQLDLAADMVVLSACETGIGELQQGEGIISMARGFTYAGAKSIVTSLWSVNDVATKDLMVRFYTYLKQGMTKDEALRAAKLDYIKQKDHRGAHPFYWASFIAIGDMSSLDLQTAPSWYWFLLLLLPLLIFLSLRLKR